MQIFRNFVPVIGVGLLSVTAMHAQDVTLRSDALGITIVGEVLSFENNVYRLRTPALGEINVDGLTVVCDGAACPITVNSEELLTFTIAGEAHLSSQYLTTLALGLSNIVDGTVSQLPNGSGELITGAQGTQIALQPATFDELNFSNTETPQGTILISRDYLDVDAFNNLSDQGENNRLQISQQIVGLEATVIVTSPRNPLRAISIETLAQIFSGEITNWSEMGLSEGPIRLYAEAQLGPTTLNFSEQVLAKFGKELSPNVTYVEDPSALDMMIAEDPLGLGLGSLSQIAESSVLNIQDSCGVQIPPSAFSVKTEEYPLTQRIYAYSATSDESDVFKRFIMSMDSDDIQIEIEKSGIVGLNLSSQSPDNQGFRLQSAIMADDVDIDLADLRNLSRTIGLADRLSITFRFETGSAVLDRRAVADIDRLAQLVNRGDFENKQLLFIGFTDAVGDPDLNAALAGRRAASVRELLLEAIPAGGLGTTEVSAVGFGEIAPVNCNTSPLGRERNRRVEIWVKDIVGTAK